MLDLSQIQLATEEDKTCRLDHWAALFKATTWEEIKKLAQNDKYISEASETIYQLTQEERIRLQCEAREDYYLRQRSSQDKIAEQNAALKKKDATIKKQEATIKKLSTTIKTQDVTIQKLTTLIDEQATANKNQATIIAELSSSIAALKAALEANGIQIDK